MKPTSRAGQIAIRRHTSHGTRRYRAYLPPGCRASSGWVECSDLEVVRQLAITLADHLSVEVRDEVV